MKEGIKMKKLKLLILLLGVFLLSGCNITKDSMENINIYTTTYPIKYLITSLYGNNSSVYSIYPSGVNTKDFELSDKKLKEYSNTDLFVFNSLDRERDYAVKMINYNKKLKVIDVSMGMTYENDIAELWLNPYNYLMMAQNTKNGLLEYITNPYLISNDEGTGIENKYDELKYNISRLDADMKESISLAPYKTIVVDNDMFKYLEKYNLKVISLEETDALNENIIDEVKKLIRNGEIKYIYTSNTETNSTCQKLIEDYNLELVTINTMESIDGGITNSNESYITIMNNNLELFNKELYK